MSTSTTKTAMYEQLDKILKKLVAQIYYLSRNYRRMKLDEMNVVGEINKLYRELEELSRAAFEEIAEYYYRAENGKRHIDWQEWLDEFLRTPSPVLKYSFGSEAVRKRDRLVEALIATTGSVAEFDKAMSYWAQMSGWEALEVADEAILEAREENGVELVAWRSEHDNKVCNHCWELNGKIFSLDDLPPKPHPNCRCWTEVVEEGGT